MEAERGTLEALRERLAYGSTKPPDELVQAVASVALDGLRRVVLGYTAHHNVSRPGLVRGVETRWEAVGLKTAP